jgi:hypothetical protein
MSKQGEAQMRNVQALDAWVAREKGRSWECVRSIGWWTVVGWLSGEEQWIATGATPENARAAAQAHLGEDSADALRAELARSGR